MYTKLSVYEFRDAFKRAGRGEQFSYEALGLIYDYLEEIDSDLELDVVAICCDFVEQSPKDIARAYNIDIEDDGNELLNVLDYLHDETSVIGITEAGDIIYSQF
jgi:hypothetical protein